MLALFRYYLLKELKNLPVVCLVMLITIIASFLENIAEITLLMLLAISTGLYSGNEKERQDEVIFEKVIPISIFIQLKSSYLFLVFKILISMGIYVLVYLWINQTFNNESVLQLATFSSLSLSMGAVVIYKNFMENQVRKISYYSMLALLFVLSIFSDILSVYFNFEISDIFAIGMTSSLYLVFCSFFFVYSLISIRNFRREKYAKITRTE